MKPAALVESGVVRDRVGNFYGFASEGGISNCPEDNGTCGLVFRVTPNGGYSVVYVFRGGDDGGFPESLTIDKKGNLYGTTAGYAPSYPGTIFRISPSGEKETLHVGGNEGAPQEVLVGSDGYLYGTSRPFSTGDGVVFRLKP